MPKDITQNPSEMVIDQRLADPRPQGLDLDGVLHHLSQRQPLNHRQVKLKGFGRLLLFRPPNPIKSGRPTVCSGLEPLSMSSSDIPSP